MLFLLFQLGEDRYALDIEHVVEVLPMVNWKWIPGAAQGVAGVFNYHGTPVPLIDLAEMVLGEPSKALMSSRIFLVKYRDESGGVQLLGLLVEHATDTLRRVESDFTEAGVTIDAAPYLGSVTTDERGIIQRIEVKHLLSPEVRDELFHPPFELV